MSPHRKKNQDTRNEAGENEKYRKKEMEDRPLSLKTRAALKKMTGRVNPAVQIRIAIATYSLTMSPKTGLPVILSSGADENIFRKQYQGTKFNVFIGRNFCFLTVCFLYLIIL